MGDWVLAPRWTQTTTRATLAIVRAMSLDEVRSKIDDIDFQIVRLLARRQPLVMEAATLKTDAAAVAAPERRAAMMARLQRLASEQGLAPEVVDAVWTAMIDTFIALELAEHQRLGQSAT
jgi:isochorismate pyruvate lyase